MALDFCPYCFGKIENKENLAYELVFPNGTDWETIKEVIGITNRVPAYISENDKRRSEYFDYEGTDYANPPIILRENKRGGESGFKLFCKKAGDKPDIDEGSRTRTGNQLPDEFYGGKKVNETAEKHENASESTSEPYDIEGDFDDDEMPLTCRDEDGFGSYRFINRFQKERMFAYPCCPNCHMRLPSGWLKADSFCPVTLLGPTESGKTALLLSAMSKNWEKLQGFSYGEKNVTISAAHDVGYDEDYDKLLKIAHKMAVKDKSNPEPVMPDPTTWTKPVFLRVDYGKHSMIMGIYDNAGEKLKDPDPRKNPNLRILLKKMFAEIYMIDPAEFGIGSSQATGRADKVSEEALADLYKKAKVLSIEEQGEEQRKQKEGKMSVVSARDLLKEAGPAEPQENTTKKIEYRRTAYSIFNDIRHLRALYGVLDSYKNMYSLGVISKSDLLRKADLGIDVDIPEQLFQTDPRPMADMDQMQNRSDLIRRILEDLLSKSDQNTNNIQEIIESVYGKGHYWQCVSAIGCNAERHGKLLGDYAPIRAEEPFITCILLKMRDEGWI